MPFAFRLFPYFATLVVLGTAAAVLGPTLPGLAGNSGSSLEQISVLFTARSLGALFGSFFIGRLFDRLDGHRLMATMLAVLAGAMVMIPLGTSLWLLFALMLLMGAAEGTLHVGGNTLLLWRLDGRSGSALNTLHFCFGVGALLAPLVVGWTLGFDDGSIRWGYWLLALPIPAVAAWVLGNQSPTAPEITTTDPPYRSSGALLWLVVLFFVLYVGAEVSFGGLIHTYAVESHLEVPTTAAFLTSAFWGMVTLGRLISIGIAARFRPRSILAVSLAGCMLSLAVLLLFSSESRTALWAGTIGVGLSMSSMFPTMMALARRRMRITGRVTSWFLVGASIGGMTLPWLIGILFEHHGPLVMPAVVLATVVAAAAAFVAVWRADGLTG